MADLQQRLHEAQTLYAKFSDLYAKNETENAGLNVDLQFDPDKGQIDDGWTLCQ